MATQHDSKPGEVDIIERTVSDKSVTEHDAIINSFTPEEQKRITRRIDFRLVTILGFMYCVSLMDRTNLGIALVAGMAIDLELLVGFRYSTITLVFFVTYVILQPPATVLLRKVGPRIFLPAITVLWGITMLCFGFVKSWTDMIPLRLVLGIFEAGFFPGCAYLLSCWYPRYDLQKRYAVFYLIANKTRSCAIPFLNQREASLIVARIEKDRSDAIAEPFSLVNYLKTGLDLKIWGFAALFGLSTTNSYAIAYFLPVILKDSMGFSLAKTECLIAPPYVLAAIWMYFTAVYSDKYRIRGPLIIANALMGIVGLPLLGFATTPGVRYFGVFLATTACNSNIPTVLSFQANNIRGQWKRALASATLVGSGGIGGIIGSTVFRSQDAPAYRPGMYTTIVASVLVILITLLLDWKFIRANKRAAANGKIIEGLEGFRYTL